MVGFDFLDLDAGLMLAGHTVRLIFITYMSFSSYLIFL